MDIRVFFTTTNYNGTPEIFETLQEATKFADLTKQQTGAKDIREIWVAIVKHSYKEENEQWNYDDFSDTFEYIHQVEL